MNLILSRQYLSPNPDRKITKVNKEGNNYLNK